MLPLRGLTIIGSEMRADVQHFVNEMCITLLNIISQVNLSSKNCKFLGTNDIYAVRGEQVLILVFSRDTSLIQPRQAEFPFVHLGMDEDVFADKVDDISGDSWNDFWTRSYGCVEPFSVVFPLQYLDKSHQDWEDRVKEVAQMLVDPTEKDIERKNRIVRVNPIFTGRDFLLEDDLCFVIMEFKDPYNGIYDRVIKPTVEQEGFRCLKANDIYRTAAVIEDVWANINKAALIIAEISSNNPNVMYELGICHTVGKEVMMLTQHSESIPFNFRHMRCFPYQDSIEGATILKQNIEGVVRQIKARRSASR